MDAVKFIKEKLRMCNNFKRCENCELHSGNNKTGMGCGTYIEEYPKEAVAIVEKWSQDHPHKTMLQDFLEKHPKAIMKNDGIPEQICPDTLGYEEHKGWCDGKCVKCWNRPLEE